MLSISSSVGKPASQPVRRSSILDIEARRDPLTTESAAPGKGLLPSLPLVQKRGTGGKVCVAVDTTYVRRVDTLYSFNQSTSLIIVVCGASLPLHFGRLGKFGAMEFSCAGCENCIKSSQASREGNKRCELAVQGAGAKSNGASKSACRFFLAICIISKALC